VGSAFRGSILPVTVLPDCVIGRGSGICTVVGRLLFCCEITSNITKTHVNSVEITKIARTAITAILIHLRCCCPVVVIIKCDKVYKM